MSKAKVTQTEANDYMAGWKCRHEGRQLVKGRYSQAYERGWSDCHRGVINFDLAMGPDDFEGEGYLDWLIDRADYPVKGLDYD